MSVASKIPKLQKFNYAIGDFSSSLVLASIHFYLLYFMITVGGLSPYYASIVFLVNKITDGLTDYLMGVICDFTMAHKGSRRMFILWGAIPFGLFFVLLWVVPNTSVQLYKFIYYLCIYGLYDTIWTVAYIPYNSLLANITDDYDERTSLNGWRVMIANIGMIIGAGVFPLFAEGTESIFYHVFGSEKHAYFFTSLLFGSVAGILMLICAINVRERPSQPHRHIVSPIKTLREFLSMREFRNTLLYYMFAMTGIDVVMSIYVFYLSDSLAITDSIMGIFLAIPLVLSTFSAAYWVRLSTRYSKHRIYLFAVLGIVVALSSTWFIPEKGYLQLAGFCAFSGFFMAALQILPFSAIPDVVEADEYYHGVRREGSYFGVVQFAYNISSGIATAIVAFILGLFGYVEYGPALAEGFVQPESALRAIRAILAIFPSLLFVGSAIFSRRIHMDRIRFNSIKQEIADRKKK